MVMYEYLKGLGEDKIEELRLILIKARRYLKVLMWKLGLQFGEDE